MTNKYKIIEHIIITVEGVKYTDIKDDKGGPTKFGITQKTYSKYLGRQATKDDVKNMTMDTAIKIYDKLFWEPNKIDNYPEELRHLIFDMYINHSPTGVGKILQRALNSLGSRLAVDGIIGQKTFNEISCYSPNILFNKILEKREQYYKDLVFYDPTQSKFINGWLKNRVEWFKTNKLS